MQTNNKQCIHNMALKMARTAHKGQPYKLTEFHAVWLPVAAAIIEDMADLAARSYLNGHVDGTNKRPIRSTLLVQQLGLIAND